MNTIALGRVTVISDPDFQPPQDAGGQPAVPAVEYRTEPTTLAAANAPFAILQPATLPRAGMALAGVARLVKAAPPTAAPEVRSVILNYTAGPDCWAVISQTPAFDGSIIVPDAATEGQIGDQPAAFFSRTLTAWGQPGVTVPLSLCLWEQGDLLIEIQSRGLAAAELVAMAVSLA